MFAAIAWLAAVKKPWPLQEANWPKMEPWTPFTQLPWVRLVVAVRVLQGQVGAVEAEPEADGRTGRNLGRHGRRGGWVP